MSTLASRLSDGLAELWQQARSVLYGQEDRGHRHGRGGRGRSRSRHRRRGSPSSSIIPPPHMSRRFEATADIHPSPPSGISFPSSTLPPGRLFLPVESQGHMDCPNTFAYALLGSSSLQSSPRLDPMSNRNIWGALCSILVIAVMATALAQPRWISINSRNGSSCPKTVFLGVQEFIYITTNQQRSQSEVPYLSFANPPPSSIMGATMANSNAASSNATNSSGPTDRAGQGQGDLLVGEGAAENQSSLLPTPSALGAASTIASNPKCNFITEDIISLQRLVIFFCALAILSNLGQFILDTLGTGKPWLNKMRANAVGSILGVILTIIIIFLTFVVSSLLEKGSADEHVEIRFEFSYYLVTLSGLIGLIAASCNLLRRPTYYAAIEIPDYPELMSTPLDDRWRGDDTTAYTAYMPPPAYTP